MLGYEIALFVQRAAVLKIEASRDHPDTVRIYLPLGGNPADGPAFAASSGRAEAAVPSSYGTGKPAVDEKVSLGSVNANAVAAVLNVRSSANASDRNLPATGVRAETLRVDARHSPAVQAVRERTRPCESFPFDPNTASVADLQRLGFTLKQAESIDAYRQKGGRFRRKEDFAKSYVVADSVYERLAPYIRIPRLDINRADSAAFDALPGIGGYFAAKMVQERERLGGAYRCTQQLMGIYNFGQERYEALRDLVCCNPVEGISAFDMHTATEEQMRAHPYIRSYSLARSICLYRTYHPGFTTEDLLRDGIIDSTAAVRLRWLE